MTNYTQIKSSFPGYDYEQAKDKNLIQEQEKQKKYESPLPPFLMVRSGVFNEAILLSMVLIPLAEFVFKTPNVSGHFAKLCAEFLRVSCYLIPPFVSCIKYFSLLSESKMVQNDLEKYASNDSHHLLSISKYSHKIMARILTEHTSKNDSRLFENIMLVPKSVEDVKTATAIISGHLKSHPEDAKLVLDRFETTTIPINLIKQLKNCTENKR